MPASEFKLPRMASSVQWSNDDAKWWMITLSDLTLLLLGFLVAYYVLDKSRMTAQAPTVVTPEMAEEPATNRTSIEPDEWRGFKEEMERHFVETGLGPDVLIESAPNEIVISLRDSVPFDSGTADLRERAVPVLEKVVALLLSRPRLLVEVSGHTDSVPISTSNFPSNWELSGARASRVARYLVDNGVDSSRISVRGYANQKPRAPDSSVDSRSANRRVEIRLFRNTDQNPFG
ncbi:MAG: flagellar motor protein MotB [Candidatus Binatia bacterium]